MNSSEAHASRRKRGKRGGRKGDSGGGGIPHQFPQPKTKNEVAPAYPPLDHQRIDAAGRQSITCNTGRQPHNNSPPQRNFTDQWLTAIQKAVDNIPYLDLLTRTLASLSATRQKRHPTILPPTVNDIQHIIGRISSESSIATTSNSNWGDATNAFATLGIDSDEDEDSDKDSDDNEDEDDDGAEDHTPTATAFPASVQSIQVRYLLKRAQCNLAEAYRRIAGQEAHRKHWNTCADNWQMSFDILSYTLQEMDLWLTVLLLIDMQQPARRDGHDLVQLQEVRDILLLVEHDTERERNRVIQKLKRRLEFITNTLEAMKQMRATIRERMGETQWKNNSNPTNAHADRVIALNLEKRTLEKAIEEISAMFLRNPPTNNTISA